MDKENFTKTRAEDIATGVKRVGMAGGVARLLKNLLGFIVVTAFMLLLISWGIPAWFCILVIVMMAAFVVLEVISLRRTARVNLEELNEPEPEEIYLEPGEKAVLWIPGVMRVWKARSFSILGTGKVMTPENTMLLSNHGIWILTVPLPGVDKVVSDTDIGQWQWLTAWRDIEQLLADMLTRESLVDTLKECRARKICSLDQSVGINFSDLSQTITIKPKDLETYAYAIRDKEIYLKAQGSLTPFMQNLKP